MAIFATQIWVELLGALAVAAILVAAAGGRGGRWAAVAWALLATAVKTRLGLLVFPPALAAWWGNRRGRVFGFVVLSERRPRRRRWAYVTMGHPFGIYRRLHHLLPSDPAHGRCGSSAGSPSTPPVVCSSPRRCGWWPWPVWSPCGGAAVPGERMLLLGCGLTVGALLHSLEWYGGGSPPARYLVPMLPAVALAGGMLLREPRRWRRAAEVLLLPSLGRVVGPGDETPPVDQPRATAVGGRPTPSPGPISSTRRGWCRRFWCRGRRPGWSRSWSLMVVAARVDGDPMEDRCSRGGWPRRERRCGCWVRPVWSPPSSCGPIGSSRPRAHR